MHRVVVHVPEEERVDQALANARNLLDDLPGIEVVLILNGDAVTALRRTSAHAGAVSALLSRGVRVSACGRSLRKFDLDPASLEEGVVVVPGGVAEVVRLEGEGFVYLRP